MSFVLSIDRPAWERDLRETYRQQPGLVPVIKGNGYGFGPELLAQQCTNLDVQTVAVGLPSEIPMIRRYFSGNILVMSPLQLTGMNTLTRPTSFGSEVLRTVAHPQVLQAVARLTSPPRVVVELDSPVHRHGIPVDELPALLPELRRVPLAGLALHLPTGLGGNDRRLRAAESALKAIAKLRAAGVEVDTLWISHLTRAEVTALARQDPLTRIRPRVGTGLWLADRTHFTATGTVLDTHAAPRREAVGYRQRRSPAGTLIVVSGGTAHGVGLHSSVAHGRWRDLAKAALAGAAHAAGLSASPFHWAGRRLRFADVPHMQVSMLLVPAGTRAPDVGDRLTCDVRMTVSTFDEITMSSELRPAHGI